MKITELLDLKSIDLNPQVSSKEEAIDHMVDLLDQSGKLNNKEVYKESVLKREAQSTTGIGDGVAIPHGQSEGVQTAGLAAMVIKEGLDFQSLDGKPTYLFFMIGAPKDSGGAHLQALAQLSTLLMEEDFRNSLINASSKEEFLKLIDEKENKKEQSTDAQSIFLKITEIILRLLYTVHLSDCSFCISDVRGFPHLQSCRRHS